MIPGVRHRALEVYYYYYYVIIHLYLQQTNILATTYMLPYTPL